MKITVNEMPAVQEQKFPCLMHNPKTGAVFLILSQQGKLFEGIKLRANRDNNGYKVGTYLDDWFNIEPFHGSITLSSEDA